jgi:3-oxoacyl-[acyl-carrier-protein] synthase-1
MTQPGSVSVELVVTGIGMVTAVGFSAAETAASVRARLTRFAEIESVSRFLQEDDPEPTPDDPVVASGGVVPGLDEGLPREERCFQLGEHALRAALEQAGLTPNHPSRVALLLALPSLPPGTAGESKPSVAARLAGCFPDRFVAVKPFVLGHAGALEALAAAAQLLQERRADVCLVGGIDSWIDRDLLYSVNAARRLKHSKSMEGFIPGEAAAFVVIETAAHAAGRRQPVLGKIAGLALAQETALQSSEEPCLGLGLSEAILAAAGSKFNTDRIDLIVCDLNGEVYRSEEWAAALPKCVTVSPKEFKLWHPADCMGDVGAAAAAVNLSVALLGLQTGATRRQEALVFASSEAGLRGAVLLGRPR